MALTINQFCAAVASDKRKPPKLCGHKGCTKPLGPRFGEHNKIGDKPICEVSLRRRPPCSVTGFRRSMQL